MKKVDFAEYNKSMKPIHRATIKSIERNSAKYIYADKSGEATCERCESTFAIGKHSHRSSLVCPSCHHKMTVIDKWRARRVGNIHWECVGQAISSSVLAIRFYLVCREDGKIIESEERARYFMDAESMKDAKFEKSIWDAEWKKSGARFFRQYGMSYKQNRLFCLDADIRDSFFREAQKLDVLKHMDLKAIFSKSYYPTAITWFVEKASLYEKLQKVGLGCLIEHDMSQYTESTMIKWNRNETELTKMLGTTKHGLKFLIANASYNTYRIVTDNTSLTEKELESCVNHPYGVISRINSLASKIGKSFTKVSNYMTAHGISVTEYSDLISRLEKANYNVHDEHYSMPRDFEKAIRNLATEEERLARAIAEKKNLVLKAISDEISTNPELADFFNGKRGYMVYIPSSAEEFIEEGKNQNNCVGRYVDKVADKKTLVLYIRELDNPTASFITMEYCHGSIVQCMYKHNKRVEHTAKVYSFAEALANRLAECNIMVA